jgi:hypothetical protein
MVKLDEKAVFLSKNSDVGVKLLKNVDNQTPVVNFVYGTGQHGKFFKPSLSSASYH